MRKVVLFSPPYRGGLLGPPLGLLSLAGSLIEAGYTPVIIDGALEPDYPARIAREIDGSLCFGVSLLTGPMIRDAANASRMVRRLRPDLPIIFGGWHPTLLTGQTLREDYVDALEPDYPARIALEIDGSLCFGVSLLTGPMIRDAASVSRMVRRLRPDLPIIFGGWHPTLLTGQTLREDYVDAVVRHQGERTLVEILGRIERGNSLDLIPGCWFKRNGRIVQNTDRTVTPIADLPAPAYDRVDWDAYERGGGRRKLPYATSIGCPYACNYCTDTVFYHRRFNALSAERVAREVTALAARYRLDEIALVDSNFLVDIHRAMEIARGFESAGSNFNWTFQASTDLLCRMSDGDVRTLAASGVSHIGFGTESASPEILRGMNKRHQHVEDMYEAARKCAQAGIRVTYNLIFGYPGEEESHRRETLQVMGEIAARYDNVDFSPNIFTPYPGIPIWPQLKELGVKEPESLEEWADIDLGANQLPWLAGATYETLRRSISYFLLYNRVNTARRMSRSAWAQGVLGLLRKPLYWRIRRHLFQWPLELWLSMSRKWLIVRRSLLTGTGLSRSITRENCT